MIRALLATMALTVPAIASDAEPTVYLGRDEVRVSYPDRTGYLAAPYMVLVYLNSERRISDEGVHTIDTRFGPIVVELEVDGAGPETFRVLEWPQIMYPFPSTVVVKDGDEGFIEFLMPLG